MKQRLKKRFRKISSKIAALVGIVEIASMVLLFFVVNFMLSGILETRAIDDMGVIARDRAKLVENYIDGCCEFLNRYTRVPVVRQILGDKTNEEALAHVNELTRSYSSSHDHLEGLYVAEWNTFVISHKNPASVGKTFRDADSAKILESEIRRRKLAFCSGIVQAPITKAMVIPIYAPVFNDEKSEMIGFTGAAFYTDALAETLEIQSGGKIGYSLINAKNGQYIFSDDKSLVGTICDDNSVLSAIKTLRAKDSTSKTASFKTKRDVISCYYMANRDWVFTIEDSVENVFGTVASVRRILALICIAVTAIMIAVCFFSVDHEMKPIQVINSKIERLKLDDFSHDYLLDAYFVRDDELGTIASAIDELHLILEKQHQIFLEILEAQTVGTLITDADDNKIILINKVAIQFYGLDPARKHELTIQDIRAHFTKEELARVAEARNLALLSRDEVTLDTFVNHDNGKKLYIQSNVKSVKLSNGETVVIFSSIDITSRKKLEANLLVLSETDSLTQISNRRSGEYKVKRIVMEGKRGMFCLFDANKFKYVNDTFGHTAGDKVLIEIAKCMKSAFRDSDVLIRLGGDEFVVFAVGVDSKEIGEMLLNRFVSKISEIEIPDLHGHKISVSLGAVLVESNEEFSQMYSKADSLMYDCKKQGGNAYKFYES